MSGNLSFLPEGPDWVHEVKLDGYRALAVRTASDNTLLSRRGNDLRSKFASVHADDVRRQVGPGALADHTYESGGLARQSAWDNGDFEGLWLFDDSATVLASA